LNLLELDPSFWSGEIISFSAPRLSARKATTERSFERWQALRRNSDYADWAFETFADNRDFFCGKAFFDRYFTPYEPKPNETFTTWRQRIIDETRRPKSSDDMEWETRAKQVVWAKNPAFLPDRWLPIPAVIAFPHPNVLQLLTPGLSVSSVQLPKTAEITILGRQLWVDLSCSKQELVRDILAYESFLKIESAAQRSQAKSEADQQLTEVFQHRPRSVTPKRRRKRKRDPQPPLLAQKFTAWDMWQDGTSPREIAAILAPKEYADTVNQKKLRTKWGDRGPLLERVKYYIKDAERLIRASFSL
jgi:hypothetical protein